MVTKPVARQTNKFPLTLKRNVLFLHDRKSKSVLTELGVNDRSEAKLLLWKNQV